MTITLKDGPYRTFVLESESGESRLIQQDWDFPRIASAFGWTPCSCGATDGTIECEHRSVSDMVWDAYEFLNGRVGDTIEDPGYFS
jgi:hypothetical protein